MEFKKWINLLDSTPNQLSKFGTKNWDEINDDTRETYNNNNSQIKFKTTILKASLCNYRDEYILVKGIITVADISAAAAAANAANKELMFNNCAPFTDCVSEINNTLINNAKHINVIMPMYNLIEYSNNSFKISRSLWQYYRNEPVLTDADAIANFYAADNSALFKFKQKITGVTDDDGTKMLK